MRRVKYHEFKNSIKTRAEETVKLVDRSAPRRRVRDEGEAEVLVKLAVLSWGNAIRSGKLQKKGDRHYSLKIDA